MDVQYKVGMTAWIVESNYRKREVIITKISSSGIIVKFKDTGGAIRVSKSRVFETEVAADEYIGHISGTALGKEGIKKRKNQYDYL